MEAVRSKKRKWARNPRDTWRAQSCSQLLLLLRLIRTHSPRAVIIYPLVEWSGGCTSPSPGYWMGRSSFTLVCPPQVPQHKVLPTRSSRQAWSVEILSSGELTCFKILLLNNLLMFYQAVTRYCHVFTSGNQNRYIRWLIYRHRHVERHRTIRLAVLSLLIPSESKSTPLPVTPAVTYRRRHIGLTDWVCSIFYTQIWLGEMFNLKPDL